ncbi:glycosyltransferase [Fictibacillus sp. KU28468]|uniref:glycosyltransferase n=1 Tax=Fictibacillus sp. KU28468 TaxID=2991053 RepID=UPI00223DAE79|nr:glycosyltransferase [Fictibacillus sp. KU28468]UZJ79350.1 glycosyltransferase [Fictibacillus sp. KU28468]
MKTICFYISEYGYGHASRCMAIIRRLLSTDEGVRILVCNHFSLGFIKDSLVSFNERVVFHDVVTDVGYVLKPGSLQLDNEALQQNVKNHLESISGLISDECQFLRSFDVDCIVSDIVPAAFEIGEALSVPTLGISNFTWWSAYEGVLEQALLDKLESMYAKMDYFFSLAGESEPGWGRRGRESFHFYCRPSDQRETERIRKILDPTGTKKIIFVPVGMKIQLGDMSEWELWNQPDCVFVVSSNMAIHHPNVFHIPANYTESQNYVAASDMVITKAGWGTVSEAVLHQKPLIVINRSEMNEDRNTVRFLEKNKLCQVADWGQLKDLNVREKFPAVPFYKQYFNEVDVIAESLLEVIDRNKKMKNVEEVLWPY